ncbi:hypothetical protein [Acinetobacter sp. ANC 3832]|uniref:hypothetical protein n=1 Tax=Acinetobacter sp. ANC 3832 TaxID=1977874 RepID=UPI000A340FA3|nr:hypothetical protein [Acinetobacter sp. ANC 3832]OTG92561.1 hypothetical protein B9T35_12820 [Acinetobacter sp. ANC 3832]
MSLVELKQEEIEEVSGAGTFLGDSIINAVNGFNQILNSKLISSVGVVFSGVGLGLVHQVADSTGLVGSKVGIAIGRALGGDVAETQNHYEKENGEGQYTILPKFIFK